MKNSIKKPSLIRGILSLTVLSLILFSSCTKYSNNSLNDSNSNSGSGSGVGSDPLPPWGTGGSGTVGSGTGGSGTGGSGTGGSGTGGSGTGGSGTGGSGGTNNTPHAYVQSFIFTDANQAYVTYNDSVSMKFDGSYAIVFSGDGTLRYKIGSGSSNDPVYAYGNYFFKPYNYYTSFFYKTPQFAVGETLLQNDQSSVPNGKAQVRFVQLDPFTNTAPITYRLSNSVDTAWISNRTYLDHKIDTNWMSYRNINPGLSTVTFYYRDSGIFYFTNVFDPGKKYTILSNASGYVSSRRGQLPIPTFKIVRHN